ncbi:MAG: symporter small accessory protein [Thermodesulfobacteriota bacterium]
MLGLGSLETALAFWLCIVATLVCVIYGAINWNKEGSPDRIKSEKTVIPPGKKKKTT